MSGQIFHNLPGESSPQAFLTVNGWPSGLQRYFIDNSNQIETRYFICEDFGSLQTNKRWCEIGNFVFQKNASNNELTKTRFIIFNNILSDIKDREKFKIECGTTGVILKSINLIISDTEQIADKLRNEGKHITIVIATDGKFSIESIREQLVKLKSLPVRITLRLCMNDESLNGLSEEFDLNILEDYSTEAEKVHRFNPWICYGKSIHKMREFGISSRILDRICKIPLNFDEKLEFAKIIYGHFDHTGDLNATIRNFNVEKPLCPITGKYREYVNFPKKSYCVIC